MRLLADLLTALVALEHLWILVLEMFLWTKPTGLKAFGMKPQQAEATKVLAANQGLYNGFLALGLGWALVQPVPEFAFELKLFFLGCVVAAGLYGSATASRRILYIQALPAVLALILVFLAG